MEKTIIMIDDDEYLIKDFLPFLQSITSGQVIGKIYKESQREEILNTVLKTQPDIIILDYNLSAETKGPDLMSNLPENLQRRVIGFSSIDSVKKLFLQSGALGFVCKFDENRNNLMRRLIENS